jgi:hypothetical protein
LPMWLILLCLRFAGILKNKPVKHISVFSTKYE